MRNLASSSALQRPKTSFNRATALMVIVYSYTPIMAFCSRAIDGAHAEIDLTGEFSYVSNSRFTPIVGGLLLLAVLFSSIQIYLEARGSNARPLSPAMRRTGITLILVLILSDMFHLQDWGLLEIFRQLVFFVALGALLKRGISQNTLVALGRLHFSVVLSAAVFPVFLPAQAWLPCRLDKCSPANGLLASYFPHETFLGVFILLGLPLLLFLKSKWARTISMVLALGLIIFAGSRGVYIGTVVALAIFAIRRVNLALLIIPITLSISAFNFAFAQGDDLTGRGYIYNALREALAGNLLLGSGPSTLLVAYQTDELSFFVNHQHGEVPYLVSDFGVIALAVCLALIAIRAVEILAVKQSSRVLTALPFVVGSALFPTETVFTFSISSPAPWAIFLFFLTLQRNPVSNADAFTDSKNYPAKLYYSHDGRWGHFVPKKGTEHVYDAYLVPNGKSG